MRCKEKVSEFRIDANTRNFHDFGIEIWDFLEDWLLNIDYLTTRYLRSVSPLFVAIL